MIIKLLLTAFLVYITFVLFRNSKRLGNKSDSKQDSPKPVELIKDPVCETFVEKDTPFKVKFYDNYYYFCSEKCRDQFIEKTKKEV